MKYLYLLVLFLCNMAHANSYNLVDYGGYTLDQNSGLEWLDTSFTKGKSYNQVLDLLGSAQSLDGWRYATYDEFKQIFTSRGYSFEGTSKLTASTPTVDDDLFFITLIDALGATDTRSTRKDLLGLTSEDYKNNNEDSQYYGFIRSTYNTNNITSYANFSRYEDSASTATLASFLVRTATLVPEPESVIMMLLGLAYISRRASQSNLK
ncbi:PEP-CTERM sorting domain-containing protein [Methylophilus sp.]|uniref:PEP-CTERM sorting domain-containing protein n=1 Tax=Methylophilus sp. TaxID=29541 RepID=UPI0040358DAB